MNESPIIGRKFFEASLEISTSTIIEKLDVFEKRLGEVAEAGKIAACTPAEILQLSEYNYRAWLLRIARQYSNCILFITLRQQAGESGWECTKEFGPA